MVQEHYSTKKRTYKHLSYEERVKIEIMLENGCKQVEIAKKLGSINVKIKIYN